MITTFESFAEVYPKNKWIKLSIHDREDMKDNLFAIVHNAYSPIGGHVRIINPESVIKDKDLVYWNATDIDFDPDADVVIFCRKTKFGFKVSGWGHDGEKNSKLDLMKRLANLLKKPGYYVEISGKPADILLTNYKVPFVNNVEDIQTLFPNSEIFWYGKLPGKNIDGFYKRTIGSNETDMEIILGIPKF